EECEKHNTLHPGQCDLCSHHGELIPAAQERPGNLLLPQGPGGAASRELWHACPSSSGEDANQPEAETTGILDMGAMHSDQDLRLRRPLLSRNLVQ
ncbi:mCG61812, partial [Mus musculus]